jgi:ADP-ribose pyrophosphatase
MESIVALFTRAHKVGTERVYEGGIINLRVDILEYEGRKKRREVVEHNGGVVIACQPTPDEVILIRQYRYVVDEELIELPAGRIEIGEDPLPAAQRELIEETGFKAEKWEELARMYSAPGFCNEMLYMYLATDTKEVPKNLDEDEETDVMRVSLDEAWKLINAGKARDAKTVAGVSMLYGRRHGAK